MFDLSITKDPEWVKKREEQWKVVSQSLKENLRKKQLEVIHHYFLTGEIKEGESIKSEGAKFDWFPIQTPESWDYLFQYVIKTPQEFEDRFYFQFEDLSGRGLTFEEELSMWDYFAGSEFKPVITSRVPVGNDNKIVSFEVVIEKVLAKFNLRIRFLISGKEKIPKKWKININYLLTLLKEFKDESCFSIKDNDGDFLSQSAYLVGAIFNRVCNPKYDIADIEKINKCREFIGFLFDNFDNLDMPPAMKNLWEETKAKVGR